MKFIANLCVLHVFLAYFPSGGISLQANLILITFSIVCKFNIIERTCHPICKFVRYHDKLYLYSPCYIVRSLDLIEKNVLINKFPFHFQGIITLCPLYGTLSVGILRR